MKKTGFQPFYDNNSQVLILGSFPSIKSREEGFYYGNKQNRFWKFLSHTLEEELPLTINEKKTLLTKHHIALYDIVEEASLNGSSDLELKKDFKLICNLHELLPPYTKVEKILCNGKLAYNLTKNNFQVKQPIIYMPSTSPANPRCRFEDWQRELEFLK